MTEQGAGTAVAEPEIVPGTDPIVPAEGAPAAEPVAEPVAEPAAEPAPKENHDVRRMKRLLRERQEAEERAAAAEARLVEMEQARLVAAEPARDQFESDADYLKAAVAFETAKARHEIRQEIAQIQGQGSVQSFQAKAEEARKELPDFDDVIAESSAVFRPETQEAIVSSPLAAFIAYELGKDPELANRIATLPIAYAAREIGRIEARIEAQKSASKVPAAKPVAKPTSSAPAPIAPVKPKIDPTPARPANDSEWLEKRRAEKYKLTTAGKRR